MRTPTSLTLVAAGAVLLFAVHWHLGFVSLPVVGVILILTGVAGWVAGQRPGWLPARAVRAWLTPPGPEEVAGQRVTLTDILDPPDPAGDQRFHERELARGSYPAV